MVRGLDTHMTTRPGTPFDRMRRVGVFVCVTVLYATIRIGPSAEKGPGILYRICIQICGGICGV